MSLGEGRERSVFKLDILHFSCFAHSWGPWKPNATYTSSLFIAEGNRTKVQSLAFGYKHSTARSTGFAVSVSMNCVHVRDDLVILCISFF
uniref:Uncharacterized protein n=1 Tax=Anguilla anguilla TaxID=7936 RepID=A0A0E9TPF9_ANGAN